MPGPDFQASLDSHRAYLLRVARLQLRDDDAAQDVVQETLLAALEARAGFSGKSSLKTWLTGILKHKIVDVIRQRVREPAVSKLFDEEAQAEDIDAFFDDTGHWAQAPADWKDGETALHEKQFLDIMDFCLEKLPAKQGRVFMMREVLELETGEICKAADITATNLWVLLYRARMLLRQCLEENWFAGPRAAS